ncbi:sensor histidine kinase [Dongia sp.]|uniref:sensor histidine kinase n=1 Tax=Dongia sp. TaxID=1977262 RepID=UPI0035AFC1EF
MRPAAPILTAVPLVILFVGVLASYAVYVELRGRATDAWREATQNQTERLDDVFIDAVNATQPPLRAINGLFLGSEDVTASEFYRAISAIAPADGDGGVAMAYLEHGTGGYKVPYSTGFARYGEVGADSRRWPGLAAAAAQAAKEPQRLLLTAEPLFEDALGPRFALIVALKGGKRPPLLLTPIDLEQILAAFVAEKVPAGLSLSVAHRALAQGELYPVDYRPLPGDPVPIAPEPSQTIKSLRIAAGAEWQMVWQAASDFQGGPNRNLAQTVLIGGISFSMLCALLFLLARHEIQQERNRVAAAKQTTEMFRHHMIDLAEARDAAERANRAKSDFLANMSHELRTPLNAIIGFSDMMKLGIGGKLENEKHLECVRHISDSGSLLFKLIDQLFDTAKIESGHLEMEEAPHDPVALAREALALVEPAANAKQIRLHLETAADLPRWIIDERSALQILNNLLTNAVKFSGREKTVTVRLAKDADAGLSISIEDQGRGIAPDALPRIFDRFARGDAMVAGKEEGLGLGLWIVRNLVEMHRGSIVVESELGRGTIFRMHFPQPTEPDQGFDPALIPAD